MIIIIVSTNLFLVAIISKDVCANAKHGVHSIDLRWWSDVLRLVSIPERSLPQLWSYGGIEASSLVPCTPLLAVHFLHCQLHFCLSHLSESSKRNNFFNKKNLESQTMRNLEGWEEMYLNNWVVILWGKTCIPLWKSFVFYFDFFRNLAWPSSGIDPLCHFFIEVLTKRIPVAMANMCECQCIPAAY